MNQVILIGRLTRDVELRYTQQNMAVASGYIAVDRGYSKVKKTEVKAEGKQTADFIRVVFFGSTAEVAQKYTKKGNMIAVSGSITTGKYVSESGNTVYTTDVNASRLELLPNQSNNNSTDGYSDLEDDDDVPF